MAEPNSDKTLFRIQLFAVGAGVLLLTAKFTAYLITHSNTVLTDALESIINVIAGTFALYSLFLSAKPKDIDHPYGHGKVEFISAGFEGILIILAGFLIIGKSIFAFFEPRELHHLDWGIVIIAASGVINYLIAYLLEQGSKRHNSIVLKADADHLKSDAYTSVGILLGLGLIIFTGLNFLDNIVAIIFAAYIIYTGSKLLRKSVAGIMDEADEELVAQVIEQLNLHRKAQWIDVHNLRIIQYGNKLHIDCHVTLPWYYTLEEVHKEIKNVEDIMSEKFNSQVELFIHADPCLESSCRICSIENCIERKEPFRQMVIWNKENVQRNKKHEL